jgi:hypothetical protein
MTPEEAFSGKKPSVEHLRIFGCPVYIHVPKDKRKKLEPSGKKGIFVGYNDTSKAYNIYVPGQQKIEISKDVTFDEKIAFKKSIEDPIDSNDEEEYEAPRKKVHVHQNILVKNQTNHLNLENQLLYPRTENDQHG